MDDREMDAIDSEVRLHERIQRLSLDVDHISSDATNPFHKNRYVTLPKLLKVIRPALKNWGMTMTQEPTLLDGVFCLRTTLRCFNEQICGLYPLHPSKNDPQGYASALTYARRYSILTMLGIPTEDDDGNTGSNLNNSDRKAQGKRSPGRSTPPPGGPPNPEQQYSPPNYEASERAAMKADSGVMDDWGGYVCRFGKKYKGKTLTQIGMADACSFVRWLEETAGKKGVGVSGPAAEFIDAVHKWEAQDPSDGVFDG